MKFLLFLERIDNTMKKVHVIPHTHWDREWYFTTSRSKIYLMKDMKDILEVLENNKEMKFLLDAQASLLDDYLKWNPSDEDRIRRLVLKKQLAIGPWYTQSDLMLISGESIARNLYYGIKRCEDFGDYMKVGYVPDSFGQSGNMPQIYNEFGIKDTIFMRGINDENAPKSDLTWKGDDGSEVFAVQFLKGGYYAGNFIPEEEPLSSKFWDSMVLKGIGATASTNNLYVPNGMDQMPIRKNLSEILKKRNKEDKENTYFISSAEEYIKAVKEENPELVTIEGELTVGKHQRVHKTIYSSRSDIKVKMTEIQNYITNVAEPLCLMVSEYGVEYPHKVFEEVWKLLFENAAHDSAGSCVSDKVNKDIYHRYFEAEEILTNIVELYSRLLAMAIDTDHDSLYLTCINTLPFERKESIHCHVIVPDENFVIKDLKGNEIPYTIVSEKTSAEHIVSNYFPLNPSARYKKWDKLVELDLVLYLENISPFGYEVLKIETVENASTNYLMTTCDILENEYYKIQINENGSLTVTEKASGKVYENQAVLMENGDDGDSFNYSPAKNDMLIYSTDFIPTIKVYGSELIQKAEVSYKMIVPADLEERVKGKAEVEMPVRIEVGLRKGSSVIDFNIIVDNKGKSHRLSILFDSKLSTSFNYADQQFGCIRRDNVHKEDMKQYNEALEASNINKIKGSHNLADEIYNGDKKKVAWHEVPISIEPTQSYVSLSNDGHTLALIPKGVREYEIMGEEGNLIRLTLFRTYSTMGKSNLLYRPGRASGETRIPTPEAELLKEIEFSLGAIYTSKPFNESNVGTIAKEYNTPVQIYEFSEVFNSRVNFVLPYPDYKLPEANWIFKSKKNLCLSAIKKAEDKDGAIIRLYNGLYKEAQDDILTFNKEIKYAAKMNLKEEIIEEIHVKDKHNIEINDLGHCKLCTIYIELKD
jgi:mannosylglycerate hydrolase